MVHPKLTCGLRSEGPGVDGAVFCFQETLFSYPVYFPVPSDLSEDTGPYPQILRVPTALTYT